MAMQTGQVFVSHTSEMARFPRGRSFVQAVLDAVGRAGMASVAMRYFGAREDEPADYCRQRVRDSDVYVAVVGFRYGSLVPGDVVSFTELEFVEATVAGLPRLVFLLDETAGNAAGMVDVERTAVDRFRRRLREAGVVHASFTTVEGLELAVFQSLIEVSRVGARAVPRQLPAAVPHLAGRSAELATLTGLVRGRAEVGGTVVISAIGGTAGVGKTALAVYWAHRVADRFPDGQLYVNMRGFDPSGQVMSPTDAVRGFLDALGVATERIPPSLESQAALYRSTLAGKRILVVLDNVRDAEHARPLLPGNPTALALVTSRNQLTGLVAVDGARPLNLDLLTDPEAHQLLTHRLGPSRVAAEPQAVTEIIAACARLPLALTIAAARAEQSGFPLTALAAELADVGGLDGLDAGDVRTRVRAVFSWSYTALDPGAAQLFRLLGLHPGPDISVAAAAGLAGYLRSDVRPILGELARASLLTEHVPGRYVFHDLLRAYAADLTNTHDPVDQRSAATGRLLDQYLHTAFAADRLLRPHRYPTTIVLSPPAPGSSPESPNDHTQAMAWLTSEHHALIAAVGNAAEGGFDTHTWQLAWAIDTFLDRRGHWHDQVVVGRAALAAAERLGDQPAQAHSHVSLAWAHGLLGHYLEGHTHLERALDLYNDIGDCVGQAHTHNDLAISWRRQGRPKEALGHDRQALDLFQAAGHTQGEARALNAVGWCTAALGDHTKALTHCEQALSLLQRLGDRQGEANSWVSLGYIHHHLADYPRAVGCYQRSLEVVRTLGSRYDEGTVLTHLGDAHHAAGEPAAAGTAWQHALDIFTSLDHPDAEPVRTKLAILNTASESTAP